MNHLRFSLTVMFFALALLASAQSPAKLSGVITHPVGRPVGVLWYPYGGALSEERVAFSTKLDDNGAFQLDIPLDKPRVATLSHGRETTPLFLFPGDKIEMKLDPGMFDETISYSGDNASAKASNFLAAWFLKFDDGTPANLHALQVQSLDIPGYMAYSDKRYQERISFLQAEKTRLSLPDELVNFVAQRELYKYALERLQYPYMQEQEELPELPAGYYDFLSKVPVNQESAVGLSEYANFLEMYLIYRQAAAGKSEISPVEKMEADWKIIGEVLTGNALRMGQGMVLSAVLREGYTPRVGELFDDLAKTDDGISKALRPVVETARKLGPGNPAPAFTLVNMEGKEVSLADMKGKVVYLDFWASWCGPCRAEMPYSHTLADRFKGEDVVFMYISIDDTEKAWKKGVADLKMKGTLLWSPRDKSTGADYDIQYIPAYFIIARDGTIFARNARRPSDPEVDQQIRAALAAGR
ncbi:MAG: TlpA family protein disulfide reductase [Bacteroidetes bacterium]|nr:MAG: TlpA family protein disulfide reductase [Bacteroidota bacterium]